MSAGKYKTVTVVAKDKTGKTEGYTATVGDPGITQAAITGTSLKITGIGVGNDTVTVVSNSGELASIDVVVTPAVAGSGTPASDPSLSALSFNAGAASTVALVAGTTSYTATVANTVATAAISATPTNSSATVKINGATGTSASANLTVGSNLVTVYVVSQDGTANSTYLLNITRLALAAQDTTLASLTASGITFAFAPGTLSYTLTAPVGTTSTSIAATPNAAGATVKINSVPGTTSNVTLGSGSNSVVIQVIAPNGITTQTYNLAITIAAPTGSDASLRSLSSPDLVFSFAAGSFVYNVSVLNSIASTTIYAAPTQTTATVTVGGLAAGSLLNLAVGSNQIPVVVTAADGVTRQTYTLNVTRAAPANNDASLSSLAATGMNFSFSPGTNTYAVNVPNTLTATTVSASPTQPNGVTVRINGTVGSSQTLPLTVGGNTVLIAVTAPDGTTTQTYTLSVYRSAPTNTDASLSALTATGASLTYTPTQTTYNLSVPNGTSQTVVSAYTTQPTATVSINGTAGSTKTLSLVVGSNVVSVRTTAPDGTTIQTYTLNINRAALTSADATLYSLSSPDLPFTFNPATLTYSLTAPNSLGSTTIFASPNVAGATVVGAGGKTLAVGANSVSVIVTALDGVTTMTYTLSITRASGGSNNAALAGLTVSGLSAFFSPAMLNYQLTAPYSAASVTVSATGGTTGQTISINGVAGTSRPVSLYVGPNGPFFIAVIAPDGTTQLSYSLSINRASAATVDSSLSNFTVTGARPFTFNPGQLNYALTAPNATASVTIGVTPTQPTATYIVTPPTAGASPLVLGLNNFTITVTAPDGATTSTYYISITRDPPMPAPVQLTPYNNVTGLDPTQPLTFSWTSVIDPSGGTVVYDLFGGNTVSALTLQSPPAGIVATSLTIPPNTMGYSNDGYWQIVARNPATNVTSSSQVWHLTTMAAPVTGVIYPPSIYSAYASNDSYGYTSITSTNVGSTIYLYSNVVNPNTGTQTVSYNWSIQNGPGGTGPIYPNNPTTAFIPSLPGTYTILLSASIPGPTGPLTSSMSFSLVVTSTGGVTYGIH